MLTLEWQVGNKCQNFVAPDTTENLYSDNIKPGDMIGYFLV